MAHTSVLVEQQNGIINNVMLRKLRGSKTLDELFVRALNRTDTDPDLLPESTDDDDILPIIAENNIVLQQAHDDIIQFIVRKMNQSHEMKVMSDYQRQKYRAVHGYLLKRIHGLKTIKASQQAANNIFILPSKYYRPYAIRFWANEFIQHGTISTHQQGKHAKRVSFFDYEDIQLAARNWFMITKPEQRSIHELATRINTVIIPQALGVQATYQCPFYVTICMNGDLCIDDTKRTYTLTDMKDSMSLIIVNGGHNR